MRVHHLAMMAILTAVFGAGCDSPRAVSDNGRVNAHGCDNCHGYPPPPAFNPQSNHPVGVTASSCFVCHPSTVLNEDGYTLVANGTHRNGAPDVAADWQTPPCAACHGTPPDTGRHVFHWNRMGASATCATCHRGFDLGDGTPERPRAANVEVHMNGQADVFVGELEIPTANSADGAWSSESCLPCHDALGVGD